MRCYNPSAFFAPSKNAAWKLGGAIVKLSSYRKSLLFSGAFFHHKALAKSYLLGTRPWEKGGTIAPWKAAKEGYEMAMSMNPIIRFGIRNGLTLFKIHEWDKEILNRWARSTD